MDSHIRVYIEANWHALGCLPPVAYKVLLCLVQRADSLGRCFPSAEKIADDCACHVDSVWSALHMLEDYRYIGYLRKNEYDLVLGRKLPNVYQVNPAFICIADEYQDEALRIWKAIQGGALSEISGNNQQQEPTPRTNTNEPTKVTNNNNHHQETNNNNHSTFEEGAGGHVPQNSESPAGEKAKSKKAKSKGDSETGEQQQGEARQRSKQNRRSAVGYAQPGAVVAPIADALAERLAEQVHRLGIPIALARGFVVDYGAVMVEMALLQLAAAKQRGQDFSNEAGFFRHLLQNNLVDSSLPEVLSVTTWSDLSSEDEYPL